ncbi:MAG: glycogen/starch synthase [Myxococcota bacterium]
MHILFATPEISPFSQEGALADFCARLAGSIRDYRPGWAIDYYEAQGIDPAEISSPIGSVAIITPLYSTMDPDAFHLARRLTQLQVPVGKAKTEIVEVYEGVTEERVPVFFLKHESFGEAPETEDLEGSKVARNGLRYAFFARSVLEFCRSFSRTVDLIHCFGWATAMVPVYLCTMYEDDPKLLDTLTVLHLRDLEVQGSIAKSNLRKMGFTKSILPPEDILLDGRANLLRSGILYADMIVSDSEAFAVQIQLPEFARGLEGDLQDRKDDLRGIVPGLDYEQWDPDADSHLPVSYNRERPNGKRRNKADLQHIFGLPIRPLVPLVGLLGPLTKERGISMIVTAIEDLLQDELPLQLIAMGDGDEESFAALVALAEAFPKAIGLHFESDDALMHRVIAGADVLVEPSPINPHGRYAAMAMRYGTIPVAFRTGGNIDLVADYDEVEAPYPNDRGVGLLFAEWNAEDLAASLDRIIEVYRIKRQWRPVVDHCMSVDVSLAAMAHKYVLLYEKMLSA